jgi:hypothetical protein
MLSRKISVTAGFRFMPSKQISSTGLGKQLVKDLSEEDRSDYDNITASNTAYTLEFRLYGGRHPGARGFYISLYGRYADFKLDYPYDYYSETNGHYTIPLNAKLHGIGGGIGFGAQWLIAKHITLDWSILGTHYGSLSGSAIGTTNLSELSEKDKEDLRDDINSLINISDKQYISATVTNDGVQATAKGPFVGIKAGISIGIAF